jgi:4-coumarate--CoA ligase
MSEINEYNTSGELILQGPNMMSGYWDNEEANKKAFYIRPEDGTTWYRTGDVVSIDQKGYLRVTDRIKDVIKVKGFQVSPAELEEMLFEDARVQDVAVVGISEKDRELPWAFVVASPSVLEVQDKDALSASILDRVNSQIASYKKLQGLSWLQALPKR